MSAGTSKYGAKVDNTVYAGSETTPPGGPYTRQEKIYHISSRLTALFTDKLINPSTRLAKTGGCSQWNSEYTSV